MASVSASELPDTIRILVVILEAGAAAWASCTNPGRAWHSIKATMIKATIRCVHAGERLAASSCRPLLRELRFVVFMFPSPIRGIDLGPANAYIVQYSFHCKIDNDIPITPPYGKANIFSADPCILLALQGARQYTINKVTGFCD